MKTSDELYEKALKLNDANWAIAAGLFALTDAVRAVANQVGYNNDAQTAAETPGALEKIAMQLEGLVPAIAASAWTPDWQDHPHQSPAARS